MAKLTLEWSWGAYLAAIYVVGATANHSLFLAIHELSHNLGFRNVSYNKMLAMVANLPIGIPYCITFKPFHMEHHRYQVQNLSRVRALSVRERSDSAYFTSRLPISFFLHMRFLHMRSPHTVALVPHARQAIFETCESALCVSAKCLWSHQNLKCICKTTPHRVSCRAGHCSQLMVLWLDGGQRGCSKIPGVQLLQKNINQFFYTFGITLPLFLDPCWLFRGRTTPGLDFAILKIWIRRKERSGNLMAAYRQFGLRAVSLGVLFRLASCCRGARVHETRAAKSRLSHSPCLFCAGAESFAQVQLCLQGNTHTDSHMRSVSPKTNLKTDLSRIIFFLEKNWTWTGCSRISSRVATPRKPPDFPSNIRQTLPTILFM